jgi:hypothetical protein
MCIAANCSWSFVYCVIILCVSLLPHVYCVIILCVSLLPHVYCVISLCVSLLPHAYCVIILCVSLLPCVYCVVLCVSVTSCLWFYYVCIAVVHTLVPGLLARSQYPEGPATGHLNTGFSWFPCVYKRMLRWFPTLHVATACFSCSLPDLNFIDPYFIFMLFLFHIYVHA